VRNFLVDKKNTAKTTVPIAIGIRKGSQSLMALRTFAVFYLCALCGKIMVVFCLKRLLYLCDFLRTKD
ncbi:hypothetical protein LPB87_13575, partial [Flavobacterium sp. EDS]|uniref:hypothetical protein n=1 Tax=Flavobacterium sp. EDS TaxID=2897328 RepID=UPI001E2E709E